MPIAIDSLPRRPSPAPATRAKIHCAQAIDEVDALESSWREIHDRVPSPLGQFNWTRACLSAFPEEATPHVVAAMSGPRLAALAPLVKKRRHGVTRLHLAGTGDLLEPMDLVWTDEQACARLFQTLARGGVPLVLERMPADSRTLPLLRRAYWGRALVRVRPCQPTSRVELDDAWLEPESRLSELDRFALERARHSAEAIGAVTTEICAPDLDELSSVLDEALEIEANGWRTDAPHPAVAHEAPLQQDPSRAVFYLQYARAACVEGALRVCFLRIDGRAVAMQIAIDSGGAFWLLLDGYDKGYSAVLPDRLLGCETLRHAAEAGLTTFEMLGATADAYRAWNPQRRACVAVSVYPLGLRGLAAMLCDLAVALDRRWRAPFINVVQTAARWIATAMMRWL
jgi:CelD/BcsL family acetyltransferase involved in cellulose biosynthesis